MPTIRLLNYNSFQKPMFFNDVKNEYKGERCDYFADNEISKFDIIALQEQFTFMNPRPINLLDKAVQKGFEYFYKSPEPAFTSKAMCGDGLVVLSRFTILDSSNTVFEASVSIDRLISKGAAWVLIELPNKTRLHLFNTHLVATFSNISEDEFLHCKIKMINQLIHLRKFVNDKIKRHYLPGDLAILCGDLNIDALNDNFSCGKMMNHVRMDEGLKTSLASQNNELKFYETLLEYDNEVFKLSHTFFRDHLFYPVSMGNYYIDENDDKIPMDLTITAESDRLSHLSLDHMYELHVNGKENKDKLKIILSSNKIEEFFVKNQPFTQLSDHYGLSIELEYF